MNWKPTHYTRAQLEERQITAIKRIEQGEMQKEIARDLEIAESTLTEWKNRWKAYGLEGIKARISSGRPSQGLDEAKLLKDLEKGAKAFGYLTEEWTLKRVAHVILAEQGISYHITHVSDILKRMGYSRQKTKGITRERNEEVISNWVRTQKAELKKNQ